MQGSPACLWGTRRAITGSALRAFHGHRMNALHHRWLRRLTKQPSMLINRALGQFPNANRQGFLKHNLG